MNNANFDYIDANIYEKNLQGEYVYCNQFMADFCNMAKEDIIYKTDYQMPWKNYANKLKAIDQKIIFNKKPLTINEWGSDKKGNVRKFLSTKKPVFNNNNNVIGIFGVSMDITKEHYLEEKLQQYTKEHMETANIKERFLQNIVHEAKNPLACIIPAVELLYLQNVKLTEEQKSELIKNIYNQTINLEKHIDNLLNLSNFVKNNGLNIKLKQCNFTELVQKETFRLGQIYGLNITLESSKTFYAKIDKKNMRKVFENILLNSKSWGNSKNIKISLCESLTANNEKAVQCIIEDEGKGVPEQELELIFDVFVEGSHTTSKACGKGIGLAACKQIIGLHAGNIWAENNIFNNSLIVNFYLPQTM